MNTPMAWCFWISFVALLATKAADVVSTWRHIGSQGESNPIVRPLLLRVGLARGLAIVSAVYLLVAVAQYSLVWATGWPTLIWTNALLGLAIAWIQWDVARFNSTGRHSAVTRTALSAYLRWAVLQERLVRAWRARIDRGRP